MGAAGIIAEYNPLHLGHRYQMERTRALLGEKTPIVCVMSGNFVQRGAFAIVRKHVRAEAAVCAGADLVLELPLPWALASAERFARGGVRVLQAAGVVSHLSFGSESGDAPLLMELARGLLHPDFPPLLRQELRSGDSFPRARQRALEQLLGTRAHRLEQPNDLLGVEYCKALVQLAPQIEPLAILRTGAWHDGEAVGGIASASAIRALLEDGKEADRYMTPDMARLYREELAAGRAPVNLAASERAVLARLRTMEEADWALYDEGAEGLYHRFYDAAISCATVEELLRTVKTKRYPMARLRRMLLRAYLGLRDLPEEIPYLRVLAAGPRGRELLARMRRCAELPVLTKPADVRCLSPEANRVFALEARAADLYALAYPSLCQAAGGSEWTTGPHIQTP
ncbi:nucleotidyltransferase family protein [Oscillibacter hominis]|uniref:tRNA(Met) cytidine acetate ligase n=1 Tax=Oscillibacter hominis TaxID=2763056 RepID=A0A7G9B6D6_9FIRM|nr:nucleotidyltransferase family protein [Oscillibacter hominis]QNL45117.1 nucleotidyltransferase family protein [Oscillibacter hominis]